MIRVPKYWAWKSAKILSSIIKSTVTIHDHVVRFCETMPDRESSYHKINKIAKSLPEKAV